MSITLDRRCELLPADHRLFANCHASTIVALPGGDLLAAYFAGTREGEGDTAIWLSRFTAGAWRKPVRAFAAAGTAHWNPVLHAEGTSVWLFYKTGPTVHDWTTRFAASIDAGRTWNASRALVPGDETPRGPVKNKLIVLSDGAWLAPASTETAALWDASTDRSENAGATWRRAEVPIEHIGGNGPGAGLWSGLAANALWETDLDRVFQWDGVIQPTLWESSPGQVHMLLRSTRGKAWRSDSVDGGRSWGIAYATDLPNNNSGLDLVRLADGRLILACNPVEGNWGRRTPLSLLTSADNGQSWSPLADLETAEGEFSYPAVIAASDGTVHVTYTANRLNIVHHHLRVIPEETSR